MTDNLHRAVGRLEGQLERIIDLLGARNARDDAHDASVDKRVSVVERNQAWYSGAAAAVGAIAAYVFKH
jgi:hypothetical protein